METIEDFTIVKEKIIKTDELISLYVKTQNQLKKVQAVNKQAKECPDDAKTEIKKLKAYTETLNNTLDCMRQKITSLENEKYQLTIQCKELEDKYNEQIIKNQLNCQNYTEKLESLNIQLNLLQPDENKKKPIPTKKLKELQEECKKYKNLNNSLTEQLTNLTNSNSKLQNDLEALQLTVSNRENNKKVEIEKKTKKNQEMNKQLQELSTKISYLELENESLHAENKKLKGKVKPALVSTETQTDESIQDQVKDCFNHFESDQMPEHTEVFNAFHPTHTNNMLNDVQECFEEMRNMPTLISPFAPSSFDDDNSRQSIGHQEHPFDIPNIVITPPTPAVKQHNDFDSVFSRPGIKKKPNNKYKRFRIIRMNRKPVKTRILRRRQLEKRPDGILEALLILKKHNLEFTISNSTLPFSSTLNNSDLLQYPFTPPETPLGFPPLENRCFTEKLSCKLGKCDDTESYMLLNSKSYGDELLGFFDVKSEAMSRSNSQLSNKIENVEGSKLLDALADLVSEKLKGNVSNTSTIKKRRPPRRSEGYNSLQSETESELESVFNRNTHSTKSRSEKQVEVKLDVGIPEPEHRESPEREAAFIDRSEIECPLLLSPLKSVKGTPKSKRKRTKSKTIFNSTIETRQRTRLRASLQPNAEELFGSCSESDIDEKEKVIPVKRKRANSKTKSKCVETKKKINIVQNILLSKEETGYLSFKQMCNNTAVKTDQENGNVDSESLIKKSVFIKPKAEIKKSSFKRPVQFQRKLEGVGRIEVVAETSNQVENKDEETSVQDTKPNDNFDDCPQSPEPEEQITTIEEPKLIPLEAKSNLLAPSSMENLFEKLISYSSEEKVVEEVIGEFLNQKPSYIAECILSRVALDIYDAPDSKYTPPAPLLTETQRILLGFMSCLEENHVMGVFDSFLERAETKLFTNKCNLTEISPITRLYLAVCKLRKDLNRMRRFCCEAFYFMGDFAVPLLFSVLTCWIEVLPKEIEANDFPLAKVLVQIVHLKDCNKPGYNLLPLRNLLKSYYGYPIERWSNDDIFQELYNNYLRNPVRLSDFAILLLCKNLPTKWVYSKVEEYLIKIVEQVINENFKATVIILIGNICSQFDSKVEYDANILQNVRKWLLSLVNETTPVVVRRSIILSLKRLPKQKKKAKQKQKQV